MADVGKAGPGHQPYITSPNDGELHVQEAAGAKATLAIGVLPGLKRRQVGSANELGLRSV